MTQRRNCSSSMLAPSSSKTVKDSLNLNPWLRWLLWLSWNLGYCGLVELSHLSHPAFEDPHRWSQRHGASELQMLSTAQLVNSWTSSMGATMFHAYQQRFTWFKDIWRAVKRCMSLSFSHMISYEGRTKLLTIRDGHGQSWWSPILSHVHSHPFPTTLALS